MLNALDLIFPRVEIYHFLIRAFNNSTVRFL